MHSTAHAVRTTQQILEDRRPHLFYPVGSGGDFWVSSKSRWTDQCWILDGKRAGASLATVKISWDGKLPDGLTLLDPTHATLLHELRHFAWGLYIDRRNGYSIAPSNGGILNRSLRWLTYWMVPNNYQSLEELDSRAAERYVDWLVERIISPEADEDAMIDDNDLVDENELDDKDVIRSQDEEADDDAIEAEGITSGSIRVYLSAWPYLWQQRDALQAVGIKSIQGNPFPGRTIEDICRNLATKAASRIPALPDKIAIPLMNAAHRFIEIASDDMLRITPFLAQRVRSEEYQISSERKPFEIKKLVSDLHFSVPEDESKAWHPRLSQFKEPISVFRVLLDNLVDACVIIVQSETGMRVGEIASLAAGVNDSTGLPSCIEVRPSKSGMLDLYYLKADLSKMRKTPTREEWLLAACPCGSKIIPNAVRAIQVLQDLLAPFREFAKGGAKRSLLVTLSSRNLPVQETSVGPASNRKIALGLKSFAGKYVDWSVIQDDAEVRPYIRSKGRCLRTHQWRKTYAQYVFQVDRRLLPAIALQFKHLSLAMTEGAYVGTSFSLVSDIADHNRNMTVDLLLLNARGKAPKQQGRLAKLMSEYQSEMAKIIKGLDDEFAREAMKTWCDNRKLNLFFHGYGKCIPALAPTEAECHKRAQTVHWANDKPNYATREPSVCTGCYLFLAGEETVDYWRLRYVKNMQSWLIAKSHGEEAQFRVAKARADQSAVYLSMLGAPIPNMEDYYG